MMTAHRIERLLEAGAYDRLLTGVLRNGRELPLAARLRLSSPEAQVAAATGLGLQRLAELTYRAGPVAWEHATALAATRAPSGRFGSIVGAAAAIAGLLALLRQSAARPGVAAPEVVQRLDQAVDLGLHALFEAQTASGGEEAPGLVGDAMDSALVLWLLGDEPRFQAAVQLRALRDALAASDEGSDPQVRAVLALAGEGAVARADRRVAA